MNAPLSNTDSLQKPTVTVGIPAFNEEANIGLLLQELEEQVIESFHLDRILVISDGSSDNTAKIASQHQADLIDNKNRSGLASTQNQILSEADSDILVILNADISIKDAYFLEHIVTPIINNKADLVTPEFKQILPSTFFERVLYRSAELKTEMYEEYRNGNNIYTCCGPARAFSKRLYKKLKFKDSANEDAYSYLFAIKNGYKYLHIHDTAAYYRLPTNFSDHKKQSTRFFHSRKKLINEFGEKSIKDNYQIPRSIVVNTFGKFAMKYPFEILLYGSVLAYTCLLSAASSSKNDNLWTASTSSKTLSSK